MFRWPIIPLLIDQQVVNAVEELTNKGILSLEINQNYYGNQQFMYSLTDAPIEEYNDIPDNVRYVADEVIKLTKRKNPKDLAYETPPMKQILREEAEAKTKFLERRLDMSITGPIFKPDPKKVREALKRIRERQKTFKPTKEMLEHELEIYRLFEDTRKRAQEALKAFEESNK